MRAHDDINVTAREACERLCLLLGSAKTRYHLHVYGKSAHTADNGLIVLQSEQSGRNEKCHLLAAKHCLVGGAQSNLGLAVAYVTAKQTVHWNRLHHVALDLISCRQLAVGLLKGKGILKCLLVTVVRGESVSGAAHTLGVQTNEVLCNVLCRRRCTGFCLFPAFTPHFGELDKSVIGVCTDIFGYFIELFNGDEQFVRARILNADIIARNSFTGQGFNACVATNAVGLMHHKIARFQLGIGKNTLGAFLSFFASPRHGRERKRTSACIRASRKDGERGHREFKSGKRVFVEDGNRSARHIGGVFGLVDYHKSRLAQGVGKCVCLCRVFG